jgi:hypothetical protein
MRIAAGFSTGGEVCRYKFVGRGIFGCGIFGGFVSDAINGVTSERIAFIKETDLWVGGEKSDS